MIWGVPRSGACQDLGRAKIWGVPRSGACQDLGRAKIWGVLVIDAANVIGSKPNGWWRDRPGSARQFVEKLRDAGKQGRIPLPAVVVLEGAARARRR